jgi:hypothetical protein
MDLNTAANLAEIAGVFLVLAGFIFAAVQILQFRRQRRDLAAIELTRSFYSPEFARAIRVVLALPDGISAEELRRRDARDEDAAWLVGLMFESIGVMLDRRVVAPEIVFDLMGGLSQGVWDKLKRWAADVRREQDREKVFEWLQSLADRMKRYEETSGKLPAHRRTPTDTA